MALAASGSSGRKLPESTSPCPDFSALNEAVGVCERVGARGGAPPLGAALVESCASSAKSGMGGSADAGDVDPIVSGRGAKAFALRSCLSSGSLDLGGDGSGNTDASTDARSSRPACEEVSATAASCVVGSREAWIVDGDGSGEARDEVRVSCPIDARS